MNAMMRIHVRVTSASAAAQIKSLTRQIQAMNAQMVGASAAGANFGGPVLRQGMHNLSRYGKNLQWVGRQIEFNFTLPLVLAGAAATKWAFETEASFIRLEKVYQNAPDYIGNTTKEMYTQREELELLRRGLRALSDEFGVNLDEVNEVGAAWAQAGASGVALAKATKMTMEAMILGDLESAEATEALIAIQAQYELSSKDMQQALADLNKISNITTAGFDDLVESLQRGGGIARQAGVTIREFAAMTASIVPAAGNARRAGSSLRTIISRMMAPTNEATEMFRELGLQVDDSAWHSMSFTERLMELKDGLNGVTASQRNMALSTIGSRWQVARLAVLMSDLNSETGRYATALEGTATAEESMRTYREELEIFLTSTPQGFKILTTQMRNFAQDIVQQILPALLGLMTRIRDLMKSFTELSPRTQQIILGLALMLAVLGPIMRMAGATILVIERLGSAFIFASGALKIASKAMWLFIGGSVVLGKKMGLLGAVILKTRSAILFLAKAPFRLIYLALTNILFLAIGMVRAIGTALMGGLLPMLARVGAGIVAALTSPWVLVIGAVIGLLAMFSGQISDFIDSVTKRWGDIPKGLAQAMRSAVDVVRRALEAIANMFSSFFGGRQANIPAPQVTASEPGRTGGAQAFAEGGRAKGQGNKDNVPALLTPGEFVITKDAVKKYGPAMFEAINAMKFANGGQVPPALADFLGATSGARAAIAAQEMAEKREIVLSFAPGAGREFDALVAAITQFKNRAQEVSHAITAQERVVARWKGKLDEANLTLDVATDELSRLRDAANAVQTELNAAQAHLDQLINTPIEGMREYSDALFENEMAQKRLRLEMLKMEEAGENVDDLRDRMSRLSGEIEMLRGDREELRLAGAGSDVLGFYDDQISGLEKQREALMGGGGAQDSGIADLRGQLEELQREAEMLQLEESIQFDPMRRQIDDVTNSMQEMPFDQLLAAIIAQQGEVDTLTADYEAANTALEDQEKIVADLTAARDLIKQSYDAEKATLDGLNDTYSILTGQIRDMEAALNDFVAAATAAQAAAAAAAGADEGAGISDFAAAAGEFEIPGGTGDIGFEEGDLQALIEEWESEIAGAFGDFDLFAPIREQWEKVVQWFRDIFSGLSVSIGFGDAWESIKETFSGVTEWFRGRLDRWVGNLEPFRNAWDDLREMFEHWSERIRETFGGDTGAAGAMKTFGNVMTIVGEVVKAAANLIMDAINLVILLLQGAFTLVWPIVRHVVEQTVGALIEIFGGLWRIISGFIDWIVAIFSGEWAAAWEATKEIFIGIWDTIVGVFRGVIAIIAGVVAGLVEGIVDFFVWLWDVLVGNSIIPDMVDGIISWFQALVKPIKIVWDLIWEAIQLAWAGIKKVWQGLMGFWNGVLKPVIDVMLVVFKAVWDGIKVAIGLAWDGIKFYLNALIGFWRTVLKPVIDKMREIFASVWDKIKGYIRVAINEVIIPAIRKIVSFWNETLKPTLDRIKQKFKDIWEGIGGTIKRVYDNTIGKIFDAMKTAIEALPGAFQTAKDGIGRIWNGIKSIIGKPVKWLADNVINKLIGAFNSIASKVPGLGTLSKMIVPEFHEGGVVGEGGRSRNLGSRPLRADEEIAVLRQGERVLTEEQRRWYEANDPNAIRNVGGPFDFIGDAANAVGGAASRAGRAALNGIRDIIADVAGPAVRGALSAVDAVPIGGWWGDALKGNARAMGNALLEWIDTADDEAARITPDFFGEIVQVGREIQKMGYNVAEHPAFGGVAPVHSTNSYHYRGQAIDVNYYPRDREPAKLDYLYGWIKANIEPGMIRELLWRTKGHWGHLHLAMGGGATGWHGPATGGSGATGRGSGSPTAGGGQTSTGGRLLDNGGLFTSPTTGLFSFAQAASARPEIASPVPLMRSVFSEELQRHDSGDRTINFYGDLSFPNISSGQDAEDFISNLESLAG